MPSCLNFHRKKKTKQGDIRDIHDEDKKPSPGHLLFLLGVWSRKYPFCALLLSHGSCLPKLGQLKTNQGQDATGHQHLWWFGLHINKKYIGEPCPIFFPDGVLHWMRNYGSNWIDTSIQSIHPESFVELVGTKVIRRLNVLWHSTPRSEHGTLRMVDQ